MNIDRKTISEQLQSSGQLSISHQGAPVSQQSLPQMASLQPSAANIKLEDVKNSSLLDDGMNSPSQDKIAAERERQRQREQERRRREAVSLFFV